MPDARRRGWPHKSIRNDITIEVETEHTIGTDQENGTNEHWQSLLELCEGYRELHAAEPPLEKRALSWSRCIAFAQVLLGVLARQQSGGPLLYNATTQYRKPHQNESSMNAMMGKRYETLISPIHPEQANKNILGTK